jgi:8-oxo-dGTP diphosphatase
MTKNTTEPSPAELRFAVLSADTALFTICENELLVRVVSVNRPPHFINSRGLPGGLVRPAETADEAAARITEDKAGVSNNKTYFEQFYTFSGVNRDPRNRVVAVAYLGLVNWESLSPEERSDTGDARWIPITRATKLAYDHDEMLSVALNRLRSRVTYTTLIAQLMPAEFTLTELEKAYACLLKTGLDKRNFRKKILKLNVLKELPNKKATGRFRPAQLYKFASRKVSEIEVL